MATFALLPNTTADNLTSVFCEVDPRVLQPHSRNSSIYGNNEDVTELVNLIRNSQWVRPLVVTAEGTIISGHRRWQAVLQLGWTTVPVEVRQFPDEIAELHTLLLENANRLKNREQKVREAQAWLEVESNAARKRMSEGGKKSAPGRQASEQQKGMENFPYLCLSSTSGTTRDRLAKRVGLGSGRTYSKAAKVVSVIDQQTSLGDLVSAKELRKALNSKSVDAAYQLLNHTEKGSHSNKNKNQLDSCDDFGADSYLRKEAAKSCWNCQHRLESIDNQSIYCNKFGILNVIDKSGDKRGENCPEWRDQHLSPELLKNPTFVLQLLIPLEWRNRLEETAASLHTDAATWVINLIGTSLFPSYDKTNFSDSSVLYPQKNHNHNLQSASLLSMSDEENIASVVVAGNSENTKISDSIYNLQKNCHQQPILGGQD
ncbi:MAG: ParB/RepB/Spo0J family partition protein [Rhizonema sp. PD38]|nr:ParB/RepB/Spo0J family partition protein [Rhizonema sp. PD38]